MATCRESGVYRPSGKGDINKVKPPYNKDDDKEIFEKLKKDIIHIIVSRLKIKVRAKEEEMKIEAIKYEGYKEFLDDFIQILENLNLKEDK